MNPAKASRRIIITTANYPKMHRHEVFTAPPPVKRTSPIGKVTSTTHQITDAVEFTRFDAPEPMKERAPACGIAVTPNY